MAKDVFAVLIKRKPPESSVSLWKDKMNCSSKKVRQSLSVLLCLLLQHSPINYIAQGLRFPLQDEM